MAGFKLKLVTGPEFVELEKHLSQSTEYGICVELNGEIKYLSEADAEGYYFFKDLIPTKTYHVRPFVKSNGDYYFGRNVVEITTKTPELNLNYKAYPLAIEFYDSTTSSDETYSAKKVLCYYDEECKNLCSVATSLSPGQSQRFYLKIDDPNLEDYIVGKTLYTAKINYHLNIVTGPTTAYCDFSYERAEKYDIAESIFSVYIKSSGESIYVKEPFVIVGLEPNKESSMTVGMVDANHNNRVTVFYNKELKFTTKPLTLETEAPKIPSAGNMIARATTNISELEPNVGFQWKKYDAPESLKPSEGFAVAYGGVLEGTIHNLQIDHYYNVRAFYRDMNGKEYYGKWITVDPSDFSWFEPNVHTYDVDRVTTNGAKARGYVVQGTDDIEKQGFEYWPSGDTSKRRVAYGAYAPADNGRQTVLATGQLMTAELADLLSGTEYTVRSFVTTSASTYYGEEITFRTLEASGIEDVAIDEAEIVPVAYYRLDGTRGERPFTGLNMVVFSDGHVEKIVFK